MRPYLFYASKARRPVALVVWGLLLAALVAGEIRFRPARLELVVLGYSCPIERFIYLYLAMLAVGAGIVFLNFKMGRLFCSCACPYHQLLEWMQPPRFRAFRIATAVLACFLLAWGTGHFLSDKPFWSIPSMAATLFALVLFAVLSIILLGTREQFCRRVCPYGVLQVLLRHDSTLRVIFITPGCTHCGQCDAVCPMCLGVRKESSGTLCTNCTRCIQSCREELGEGNEVLKLWPPEQPEPTDEPKHP